VSRYLKGSYNEDGRSGQAICRGISKGCNEPGCFGYIPGIFHILDLTGEQAIVRMTGLPTSPRYRDSHLVFLVIYR
jgi:hypothetical protein